MEEKNCFKKCIITDSFILIKTDFEVEYIIKTLQVLFYFSANNLKMIGITLHHQIMKQGMAIGIFTNNTICFITQKLTNASSAAYYKKCFTFYFEVFKVVGMTTQKQSALFAFEKRFGKGFPHRQIAAYYLAVGIW